MLYFFFYFFSFFFLSSSSFPLKSSEAIHDLYDVQRAVSAEQLANDKAKGKDLMKEVEKAGNGGASLKNCCIAEPSGGEATVQRLISQNADVHETIDEKTFLYLCAENNHPDLLKIFIDNGCDLEVACTKNKQTALAIASQQGNTGCVKVLLNANADVHSKDLRGETPIFRAAESCKKDTVEALLGWGRANADDRGPKNITPIFYAARGRKKHDPGAGVVIDILIDHGVKANVEMDGSRTPLHEAVEWGCPKAVEMLLRRGANIEAVEDKTMMTPLGLGADIGDSPQHIECIKILSKHDPPANVLHMSRKGTPKRIAEKALKEKEKGKYNKEGEAYKLQLELLEVMKSIVAGSSMIKNENAKEKTEVETPQEELQEYMAHIGIDLVLPAMQNLQVLEMGSWKSIDAFFSHNAKGEGNYLLEVVLSDYPREDTDKLFEAFQDKKAFKLWRHSRQTKRDRKRIKKVRSANSMIELENEEAEVVLKRQSLAMNFSLDSLYGTWQFVNSRT